MTTVIFACVHNAGRSQMSAAFFNLLADPAKARAISAGTNPGPRVHPEVLSAMAELGVDLSQAQPQKLTAELATGKQWLITMGCGDQCPHVPGLKRDDWPLPDPKGQPVERVREIREEIRRRVLAFIEANGWGRTANQKTQKDMTMQKLEVFDPAMCCPTGVCGPSVDPKLARFAADLDWLKSQGVAVERYNLAQQPAAFAADGAVKHALEAKGEGALPLIKLNGEVRSTGVYPTREELSTWADVALPVSIYTPAVAELVSLGAALASNNERSFKCHYDKARELGVSDDDIRRAVATASVTRAHRMKAVNEMVEQLLGPVAAPAPAPAAAPAAAACCPPSADGSSKCC